MAGEVKCCPGRMAAAEAADVPLDGPWESKFQAG